MGKQLFIAGYGSHGRDIADIALQGKYREIIPFDDKYPIMKIGSLPRGKYDLIIGANWPKDKIKIYNKILDYQGIFTTIFHPSVSPGRNCSISPGVVVAQNTSLGCEVILEFHVHIGAGVTITRAEVGNWSTIGPGANICGDVKIGQRVIIGAGSTISNLITIGTDAIVGAGSVVVKDVVPGDIVAGVPARKIGENNVFDSLQV